MARLVIYSPKHNRYKAHDSSAKGMLSQRDQWAWQYDGHPAGWCFNPERADIYKDTSLCFETAFSCDEPDDAMFIEFDVAVSRHREWCETTGHDMDGKLISLLPGTVKANEVPVLEREDHAGGASCWQAK